MALLVAGCVGEPEGHILRADLRTDYRPGVDFDVVSLQVGAGDLATRSDHRVDSTWDFLRGQRIGEADALPGTTPVTISLYRSGGFVASRRVSASVGTPITVVTVVLTRSCEGVSCPNDNPAFDSCFGGRCVDPRCTPETPEFCPSGVCAEDSQCEGVACALVSCSDEVCFSQPDDTQCEASERCDLVDGCTPRVAVVGCATNDDCEVGTCFGAECRALGCVIDTVYYPDATQNPESACQVCDAASNAAAWTPGPTSSPCNDGLYCTDSDQCFDGACRGTADPCDDGVSCTTDACDETNATCSHEPVADVCEIDGTCVAAGTVNPENYSEICNGGGNDWSDNATTCDNVHAGALACGGFEDGFDEGWDCRTWPTTAMSTCAIQGSMSYRGASAIQATTRSSGDQAFGRQRGFPPVASGDLYVRAYLRLDQSPAPGRITLMKIATDTLGIGSTVSFSADGSATVGHDGETPWFGADSAAGALPVDEWFCVELHVNIGAAGFVETFVNGEQLAREDGDTRTTQPYQQLVVGQQHTDGGLPQVSVFADEVVVATAPIGCDP